MKSPFTQLLMQWNTLQNTRQMPWKGEKNPYYIWLSEIILQQTRVEQGLPYYNNFKKSYPNINKLAQAPEDEVMKLWQGLGYYSRARNLHSTAKFIANELQGEFPQQYADIVKLKGVGPYTAAAIASFAFNEKRAVVDGNVIRVLARVFGIATPYDTTLGKKQFALLADELIDAQQPGIYNQAIMDYGATVCTPQNPLCHQCVFTKICVAYNKNLIAELPAAEKKIKIKERYFTYLLIRNKNEVIIEKRTGNDIWKNLYQLPLIETTTPLKTNIHKAISAFLGTNQFSIANYSDEMVQMLTHRKIHFRFIEIEGINPKSLKSDNFVCIKVKDLVQYAFPKTIHLFLAQNSLL